MKIEDTYIPNILPENIDQAKLNLAENIIRNVYPLFDDVYLTKKNEIDGLKEQLRVKRNRVLNDKKELENMMLEYQRQKKVSKLLSRVEKLVDSGLIYDGGLRHEMVILLKVVNRLNNEKLDQHLRETLQTISKRFSK
jgi:hypothetical protein